MKVKIVVLILLAIFNLTLSASAQKITALPEATSGVGTDLTIIVSDPGTTPITKKIELVNLPFLLVDGKVGGQTIYGGAETLSNLYLYSNTSKDGKVYLDSLRIPTTVYLPIDSVVIGTPIGVDFPTGIDINAAFTTSGAAGVQAIMGVRGYVTGTAQQQVIFEARGISIPTTSIDAGYAISAVIEARPLLGSAMLGLNALYAFTGSPVTGYSGTLAQATGLFVDAPIYLGVKPAEQRGIYIANQGYAGITDAFGLYIDAPTGASGVNYSMEIRGKSNFYGLVSAETGLGVGGRITPGRMIESVDSANPQLRLSQAQASKYFDFRVDSSNNLILIGTGNVALGVASPNASAILDVVSTTKAFMPPRMTSTQKGAISTPTAGMIVYDATLNKLCVYTTAWETITSVAP